MGRMREDAATADTRIQLSPDALGGIAVAIRHDAGGTIGRAGGGHGTRQLAGRQRGGIEGAGRGGRETVDRVPRPIKSRST
jgi:hypothetical protein